ncbi:divergent PAP2 family protein [Candidatus Saccharibacteria bacterium]|nr:divergent PAP2 family protein [Candidatus Saccharibacteria bacterium]
MGAVLSPYILVVILGWLCAQGLKYVFAVIKTKRIGNFRQFYTSGNMPSSHSACVVGLATVVGLADGFDSAIFGIMFLFASIVMYDAVMVRRSSGEQGLAIQELVKLGKSKIVLPRAAKGHTPAEVMVGAVLGVVLGLVVFVAT